MTHMSERIATHILFDARPSQLHTHVQGVCALKLLSK